MTRRRRIGLAICLLLLVIAVVVSLRPSGPSYKGRSMHDWFERYKQLRDNTRPPVPSEKPGEVAAIEEAFVAMGTNAVPFLAGRITRDPSYSRIDMLRFKYRRYLGKLPLPASKVLEAGSAANLLSSYIKPPGEILVPLLEPAFQSTNEGHRLFAFTAVRGISSGHDLARPYLSRGLSDPDLQVQAWTAHAIGQFGWRAKWAVSNLLTLANSPDLQVHESALSALNLLGTNSWPVIPALQEMLAGETNDQRRKIIANAIDYISGSGPPESRPRP